jgi:hypothetical protein
MKFTHLNVFKHISGTQVELTKCIFIAAGNSKYKAIFVINLEIALCGEVWAVCGVDYTVHGCHNVKFFLLI